MKELLITGSSGFLGQMLTSGLNQEYDIITLSKTPESDITCNLAHEVLSISSVPDYVIHAAGLAHFNPNSTKDEQQFFEVNCQGTKNLLNAFEASPAKPKGFIFISTVAVYGLESGTDICETQVLKGESAYAKSKILAEKLVLEWGRKNQVAVGILRLPLLCGANPPGNLGSLIKSFKAGRYPKIGEGNNRKSMVYGPDIPKIVPKLFAKGGTFHLTDGYHPSMHEIEEALTVALGKKPIIKIPKAIAISLAKVGDGIPSFPINSSKLMKITGTLTFNDYKAREELGYQSTRVLDVMDKITC